MLSTGLRLGSERDYNIKNRPREQQHKGNNVKETRDIILKLHYCKMREF